MARLPLAEETDLDGFLKEMHDGAGEGDWSTRHVARVFDAHPEFLEQYLAFYYPWHSNAEAAEEVARLTPRTKELMRLRIAKLKRWQTCAAARLGARPRKSDLLARRAGRGRVRRTDGGRTPRDRRRRHRRPARALRRRPDPRA